MIGLLPRHLRMRLTLCVALLLSQKVSKSCALIGECLGNLSMNPVQRTDLQPQAFYERDSPCVHNETTIKTHRLNALGLSIFTMYIFPRVG